MKKISVVMASYMGDYPNRASDIDKKFLRAVKSFINQTYENKELIIIADGCDKTEELYNKYFTKLGIIKFHKIPKQPLYGGLIRSKGIELAEGDVICYLDNDDVFGKNHLEIIMSQFTDDIDMVFYDDYLVMSADFKKLHRRINETRYGSIGTSSIAHRNLKDDKFKHMTKWWSDGYGHDWVFVMNLITNGLQFKKLEKPPQYLVCRYGSGQNGGDF